MTHYDSNRKANRKADESDDPAAEPDTHYGDLREVRNELIDTHRGLKARIASDEYEGSYIRQQRRQAEDVGRRDGLIEAISEIEDVLNEWIEADDRDGETS